MNILRLFTSRFNKTEEEICGLMLFHTSIYVVKLTSVKSIIQNCVCSNPVMYDIELRLSGEKPKKSYHALCISQNFSTVLVSKCYLMFHMSSTKNLVYNIILELHFIKEETIPYCRGNNDICLSKQIHVELHLSVPVNKFS